MEAGKSSSNVISEHERPNVFHTINYARRNPTEFAKILETHKNSFDIPLHVIEETIDFVKNQTPLPSLIFSRGLTMAAATGIVATTEDLQSRVKLFGNWNGKIAANTYTGNQTSTNIVLTWVIDSGAEGCRDNIFSRKFQIIGVAEVTNKDQEEVCVAIFAEGFKGKEEVGAELESTTQYVSEEEESEMFSTDESYVTPTRSSLKRPILGLSDLGRKRQKQPEPQAPPTKSFLTQIKEKFFGGWPPDTEPPKERPRPRRYLRRSSNTQIPGGWPPDTEPPRDRPRGRRSNQ